MGPPSLLDAVPGDVLLHAASFVDSRSLARVAQASQQCRAVALHPALWRALDTERDAFAPPDRAVGSRELELLAPRYEAATLEHLVLVRGLRVSAAAVHAFLHHVAGLGPVATDEFDERAWLRRGSGRSERQAGAVWGSWAVPRLTPPVCGSTGAAVPPWAAHTTAPF